MSEWHRLVAARALGNLQVNEAADRHLPPLQAVCDDEPAGVVFPDGGREVADNAHIGLLSDLARLVQQVKGQT